MSAAALSDYQQRVLDAFKQCWLQGGRITYNRLIKFSGIPADQMAGVIAALRTKGHLEPDTLRKPAPLDASERDANLRASRRRYRNDNHYRPKGIDERKERRCLVGDHMFMSDGPGDRICPAHSHVRENDAGRYGQIHVVRF